MIRKSVINRWGSHGTDIISDDFAETITVHTAQDMQDVVDTVNHAKEGLEHIGVGHAMSKGAAMVPIAEIPMLEWEKAVRNGHHMDKDYWKRWLNDPENKHFRIYEGRM